MRKAEESRLGKNEGETPSGGGGGMNSRGSENGDEEKRGGEEQELSCACSFFFCSFVLLFLLFLQKAEEKKERRGTPKQPKPPQTTSNHPNHLKQWVRVSERKLEREKKKEKEKEKRRKRMSRRKTRRKEEGKRVSLPRQRPSASMNVEIFPSHPPSFTYPQRIQIHIQIYLWLLPNCRGRLLLKIHQHPPTMPMPSSFSSSFSSPGIPQTSVPPRYWAPRIGSVNSTDRDRSGCNLRMKKKTNTKLLF